MSNEWFYAKAGKREGPVSLDDLKQLVQQGQLGLSDHVWTQGMQKWVPASSVEGLSALHDSPSTDVGKVGSDNRGELLATVPTWIKSHPLLSLGTLAVLSFSISNSVESRVGSIIALVIFVPLASIWVYHFWRQHLALSLAMGFVLSILLHDATYKTVGHIFYIPATLCFFAMCVVIVRNRAKPLAVEKPNLTEKWYYSSAGKKAGPVTYQDLMRLVNDGTLSPTDVVQREGTQTWVAVSSVISASA